MEEALWCFKHNSSGEFTVFGSRTMCAGRLFGDDEDGLMEDEFEAKYGPCDIRPAVVTPTDK